MSATLRFFEFLDRGRLWESYEDYYGKRSEHMADWLERLFEEHFVSAYCNEAERLSQQHVPLP